MKASLILVLLVLTSSCSYEEREEDPIVDIPEKHPGDHLKFDIIDCKYFICTERVEASRHGRVGYVTKGVRFTIKHVFDKFSGSRFEGTIQNVTANRILKVSVSVRLYRRDDYIRLLKTESVQLFPGVGRDIRLNVGALDESFTGWIPKVNVEGYIEN